VESKTPLVSKYSSGKFLHNICTHQLYSWLVGWTSMALWTKFRLHRMFTVLMCHSNLPFWWSL